MKRATLRRTEMGDAGTFGYLSIDGVDYITGELPDRGNAAGISSIPAGRYVCHWDYSPKFGRNVYHVEDVPGRTHVLIHAANHMGDAAKGYHTELNGCIALGRERGQVDVKGIVQEGLSGSRAAIEAFENRMAAADFELEIIDEYLEAGRPAGNAA